MTTDREDVIRDLTQRLGRIPTDEEIELEINIRTIDGMGGKIIPVKGRHKKKK
jgi:DNA-directed RNA polymerase specialized sigma subunit